jgi:hypothetical protein
MRCWRKAFTGPLDIYHSASPHLSFKPFRARQHQIEAVGRTVGMYLLPRVTHTGPGGDGIDAERAAALSSRKMLELVTSTSRWRRAWSFHGVVCAKEHALKLPGCNWPGRRPWPRTGLVI